MTFKYNVDGIRTEKTVNGTTTSYHLLGDKVTFETNGIDEIYYTYDSNSSLISMNLNGSEYYYIRNGQGDIIGLHDNTGTQVVSYTYDTWGKIISIDTTLASTVGEKNPYRYRGYRYDSETGLYYLQSRYYNAEWGRFINADKMVSTGTSILGSNMFMYCDNNPILLKDDKGMRPAVGAGVETAEELHQSLESMRTVYSRSRSNQRTINSNKTTASDVIEQSSNIAGSTSGVLASLTTKAKPHFNNFAENAKLLQNISKGMLVGVGIISTYNNFSTYGISYEAAGRTLIDIAGITIGYLAAGAATVAIASILMPGYAIVATVAVGVLIGWGVGKVTQEIKETIYE
ncbi:MAG: RHS repeat-associated core domain-containing protein [Eubacteriaceae bacterium]